MSKQNLVLQRSLGLQKDDSMVYQGRGCKACRFTGFHGRTALTELMIMTDTLRQLIVQRCHANEIQAQVQKEGMLTLWNSGMDKVRQAQTSFEEILRVTNGTILTDEK